MVRKQRILDLNKQKLKVLPIISQDIRVLKCTYNRLEKIEQGELHEGLVEINVTGNFLDLLCPFPSTITSITVDSNLISVFPTEILRNLPKLKVLSMCNNQLTGNVVVESKTLEDLFLSKNRILKLNVQGCPKLKTLEAPENEINEVTFPLSNNLKFLRLSDNSLTYLTEFPTSLVEIDLSSNFISSISLSSMENLISVFLSYNRLDQFPKFEDCTSLKYLFLEGNGMTTITHPFPNGLVELHLQNNSLRSFPKRIPRNLNVLNIYNNDITHLNPGLFLQPNLKSLTYDKDIQINKIFTRERIYKDGENVHTTEIQKSVKDAILHMYNTDLVEDLIYSFVEDPVLSVEAKRIISEKIEDTYFTITDDQLTYMDVFNLVWNRIEAHEDSEEMKKILDQDIVENEKLCFVGNVSRLVNCLSYYYNDINIEIRGAEQISNIVIKVKEHYEDLEEQKKQVTAELEERGYPQKVINEWVSYL